MSTNNNHKEQDIIGDLLKRRKEIRLVWGEPWPGIDFAGKEAFAAVAFMATVGDCVNMARLQVKESGMAGNLDERVLLEQFIAIHKASPLLPEVIEGWRGEGEGLKNPTQTNSPPAGQKSD